ncbi:hypothetical protein HDU93_001939 [Gonapodya sp. JEL0774]|nr:hypothetical protein HDU93_001939 [Gonapodya sp. JEL0774]
MSSLFRDSVAAAIRILLRPFLNNASPPSSSGTSSMSTVIPTHLRDLISFREVEGDMAAQDDVPTVSSYYEYPDFPFKRKTAKPPLPRHIVIDLDEHPTEILIWDSLSAEKFPTTRLSENEETTLVYIAGNPGIPDYYEHFLDRLYHHFQQRVNIVAVGHLYHCATTPPPSAASSFAHTVKDQDTPLVLTFALSWLKRLLETSMQANVSKENIALTPNGQRQSMFFRTPFRQAIANVAALLRWALPMEGAGGLVELVAELSHQPEVQARVTANKLISYHSVYSALLMSDDEMQVQFAVV